MYGHFTGIGIKGITEKVYQAIKRKGKGNKIYDFVNNLF
jgi:hypothetical protein